MSTNNERNIIVAVLDRMGESPFRRLSLEVTRSDKDEFVLNIYDHKTPIVAFGNSVEDEGLQKNIIDSVTSLGPVPSRLIGTSEGMEDTARMSTYGRLIYESLVGINDGAIVSWNNSSWYTRSSEIIYRGNFSDGLGFVVTDKPELRTGARILANAVCGWCDSDHVRGILFRKKSWLARRLSSKTGVDNYGKVLLGDQQMKELRQYFKDRIPKKCGGLLGGSPSSIKFSLYTTPESTQRLCDLQ